MPLASVSGLSLLAAVCLALGLLAAPAPAQDDTGLNRIEQEIQAKGNEAEEAKQELKRLTDQERTMFGKLAMIEDRVLDLQDAIWEQEQKLAAIKAQEKRVLDAYEALKKRQARTAAELKSLLAVLWPVRTQHIEARLHGLDNWSEADRRFTWLGDVYSEVREKFAQAQAQARELSLNLAEQENLRVEAERRLDEVNDTKDQVLRQELKLLAAIQEIRADRVTMEDELKGILSTIQSLNYKLKSLASKQFTSLKGGLPWPAKGPVISKFNPKLGSSHRGIGLKLEAGEDVHAVFWGKVVHDDTLRGFGRVVIIYHGQNFYSLYAYLSDTFVTLGQEVEKDEVIGKAGYYPVAKGPGLYFELRFRQKAINPQQWLMHPL